MLKVLRYFFNNPLMVAIHLYIYIGRNSHLTIKHFKPLICRATSTSTAVLEYASFYASLILKELNILRSKISKIYNTNIPQK